jgi:nicotinamidase-related amidase
VLLNSALLLKVARLLEVPVFITERPTQQFGATEEVLQGKLDPTASRFQKTLFSCCSSPQLQSELRATHKRQVVLAGIETHTGVLHSALELQAEGLAVYAVADATGSRQLRDAHTAIRRLRQSGIVVTTAEAVVFEWLRDSQHEHFERVCGWLGEFP